MLRLAKHWLSFDNSDMHHQTLGGALWTIIASKIEK